MDVTIKDRKEWVDVLRGLAIVLVVYGHQVQDWDNYFVFTSAIKIPLFFFISGYLFKPNRTFQTFLKKLTVNIVIPYFFLVLTPSLLYIPFHGFEQFFRTFSRMISGESYWFMPCLIIAEIVFYFIIEIGKKIKYIIPTTFCIATVGFLLYEQNLLNYGMANISLEIQLFLLMGFLFRQYESKIESFLNSWLSISLLIIVYVTLCVLTIYLYPGQSIDCHLSEYYNIPYCLLLISLGCVSVSMLTKKIGHFPKLMVFIGQNSLVLYLCASLCNGAFFKLISFLGLSYTLTPISAILLTIWTIAICGMLSLALNKYCPFLVGKKS